MTINMPTNLAAIAGGRDYLSTSEAGRALSRSGQTLRKLYCIEGAAYGIRPIKLPGSTRLMWPVADIAKALATDSAPAGQLQQILGAK